MTNISDNTNAKNFAIRTRNVSKLFKIYDNPITGPIKDIALFWRKERTFRDFRAVNNVSLEIKRGEVVGILGPNGSGKTTLLKMIAGLLSVNEGEIEVRGKVTALLALGLGVHPEFSGRENIYYSGMLYGMSREEVLEKMESIIEFAELGDYIEQPMRTYSSGMQARLMFATAMAIDPDILIVDEALAAGDAFFVKKSSQRIREICRSGATILYVSHNIDQIKQLCDRAYLMQHGAIVAAGTPTDVANKYYQQAFEIEGERAAQIRSTSRMLSGTGEMKVIDVRIVDANNKPQTAFYTGSPITIEIDFECEWDEPEDVELFLGVDVHATETWVGEFSSRGYISAETGRLEHDKLTLPSKGTVRVTVNPNILLNNTYSLWIIFQTPKRKVLCEYRSVHPFFIARREDTTTLDALFMLPASFEVSTSDEPHKVLAEN